MASNNSLGLPRNPNTRQEYAFVTTTDPRRQDNATRTLVRRHVMRDIGKARRRPKAHKPVQISLEVLAVDSNDVPRTLHKLGFLLHDADAASNASKTPIKFSSLQELRMDRDRIASSQVDPFIRFPVDMDDEARQLVAYIFDDRYGTQRAFRQYWFTVGLSDPATFHQVLSNSAAHMAKLQGNVEHSKDTTAVIHMNRALQTINHRLSSSNTVVDDSIISAVTGLVGYSYIVEDWQALRLHLKGLQELIRARGGISTVQKNQDLLMTIFWVTLSGAAATDQKPTFAPPSSVIPQLLLERSLPPTSGIIRVLEELFETQPSTSPSTKRILSALTYLDSLVKTLAAENQASAGRVWGSSYYLRDIVCPLLHHLLDMRLKSDASDEVTILAESVRLAMILSLAEIRRKLGVQPVSTTCIVQKLHRTMSQFPTEDWAHREPQFWILTTGLCEAREMSEREWFTSETTRIARALKLRTWRDAKRILRHCPWDAEIFHNTEAIFSSLPLS